MGSELSRESRMTWDQMSISNSCREETPKVLPQYMGIQGMLRPISQLPDVGREPSEDTSGRVEVPALAQVTLTSREQANSSLSSKNPDQKPARSLS